MIKSDYTKYRKAIKKRFIKKLGKRRGVEVFHRKGFWTLDLHWSYISNKSARSAVGKWVVAYRCERAEERRLFFLWLKLMRTGKGIDSPGGEVDPVNGILREFRLQFTVRLPPPKIYIDPLSSTAY